MPQFSQFQMYDGQSWSGLTTVNHLAAIYQAKPQKATEIMRRVHMTMNQGTDLDTALTDVKVTTLPTNDDFTWELMGAGTKNLPLVEARLTPTGSAVAAGDQPGLGVTSFYMVYNEPYFHDENIIVGHRNELFPLQIQADPQQDGTNWVYEVKLITGDPTLFVPVEELAANTRWSREWSLVEDTLSKKGGGISFESPFGMRNGFSMIRMQHTMAGNMINRPFATAFKVNDPKTNTNKTFTMWMQYEDFVFDQTFRAEKNKMLMFARSNRGQNGEYYNIGKSGHFKKQGAGVRQQMETANTEFYSTFDIEWLSNVLLDLSEGKISTDNRAFVAKCGERGAVQFGKSLEAFSSLFVPVHTENRIYKTSENGGMPGVKKAYGFGGQFVEYIAANGVSFKVSVDSMYDDRTRNKILHPDGGVAESYRYDIFDIGTTDGAPNIEKFYVKGEEDIWGYEPGLRDPFSPSGGKNHIMSHANDGYVVHRGTSCAVAVYDPSRTASFIPNILY